MVDARDLKSLGACPCTSSILVPGTSDFEEFDPIYNDGIKLLFLWSEGPAPTGIFDRQTMWWHHEKLHRFVLLDYPTRIKLFCQERDELERSFISRACDKTEDRQWTVSEDAFTQAKEATSKWLDLLQEAPIRDRTSMTYRRYWQRQNRKAGVNKSLLSPY